MLTLSRLLFSGGVTRTFGPHHTRLRLRARARTSGNNRSRDNPAEISREETIYREAYRKRVPITLQPGDRQIAAAEAPECQFTASTVEDPPQKSTTKSHQTGSTDPRDQRSNHHNMFYKAPPPYYKILRCQCRNQKIR